jgi:hypothetical protein
MNKKSNNSRIELIRKAFILQLKLFADGLRDALLIPISFGATLIGLLRGGDDCDREFEEVIKLGRRSERWINLFGHQRPLGLSHPAGSMDKILSQVEAVVLEQYKKGRSAAETRSAVRDAMKKEE